MNLFYQSFLITFCFIGSTLYGQSNQFYLSESWVGNGGNLAAFYENHVETDPYSNVFVSGTTINSNGDHDMLLQKFNRKGDLLWERSIDGSAGVDDFSAKFFLDNDQNIYLTGSITNSVNDLNDLIVLKFDSDGNELWQYTYDNPNVNGGEDFGVDITSNGQVVVVTGASKGANTEYDYLTIGLNASTGAFVWRNSYDYSNLNDIASVVKLGSSSVYVSGGSQSSSSPIKYDVASVEYSINTGTQLNLKRSSGGAVAGVNEINDISIDNNDNIYLTGRVVNTSTGFDIVTYKLNSQLSLEWEKHFDFDGLNDVGNGIKINSQGDIIVAGYVTDSLEHENFCVLKYSTAGNLIWTKTYNGKVNSNDRAEQLVVGENDDIFVTGSSMNQSNTDFLTIMLDESGSLLSEVKFNGQFDLNDKPNSIAIDNDDNLIVVGQSEYSGNNFKNITVKYSFIKKTRTSLQPSNGDDPHLDNNIIVKFDKSKLNLVKIDKKGFVAGELSDFVDSIFIVEMNNLTNFSWDRLHTFKVYPDLTTNDTISVSRHHDTIPLPDLWASLIIEIPDGYNEQDICDTLISIFGIHRAQLEYLYYENSYPNDDFYVNGYQIGLYPNSAVNEGSIDVEGAWDLIGNSGGFKGDMDVKVGIYDHLIDYSHFEFGHGGSLIGSKIISGYNYHIGSGSTDISYANSLSDSHGTRVAGIIGAQNNEAAGIAGIAGGDIGLDPISDRGVSLYSMGIFYLNNNPSTSQVANAFVMGSSSTNSNFGYGLEIANHSYGRVGNSDPEVLEALKVSWKNGTINIAARGKSGANNLLEFPGCYLDDYLITVVASGEDGNRMDGSNGPGNWVSPYGIANSGNTQACDVDVMAPGVSSLITTTTNQFDVSGSLTGCVSPTQQNSSRYASFNGTSAAAPHVAGVTALMYSTHDPDDHWEYKNNLAIEDVEHIVEKTTFNSPNSYDLESGYGLINAKEAVQNVMRPYTVKHQQHWGDDANIVFVGETEGLNNNGIDLWLFEEDWGIQNGSSMHKIEKYRLIWDLDYTPSGDNEIIDWWETKSRQLGGASSKSISSTIQQFYNYGNGIDEDYFDLNIWVNYNNNEVTGTLQTYCYKIYPNSNSSSFFWYPVNPEYVHFTYSLHLFNNTLGMNSYDENTEENISIYPNPSSGLLTLVWKEELNVTQLSVFDTQGKLCLDRNISYGNSKEIDISNLDDGVYYVKVFSEKEIYTKRIVKKH